jgi:hypothetical protein
MEHKTQRNGVACFGEDLSNEHRLRQLNWNGSLKPMRLQQTKRSSSILFYKTGRNTKLQQQIEDGKSEALESWETGLEKFKKWELNI